MSKDCGVSDGFTVVPPPDGHDRVMHFAHMSRNMSLMTIDALLQILNREGDTSSAQLPEAAALARRMQRATDDFAATIALAAD